MHWHPQYKAILNKAIKDYLATDKEMPDHIKNLIDALSDNVKDISVELKCRTHTGDSVTIEGVLIKTKLCHFQIVSYALSKLDASMFGAPHQIRLLQKI